jgi:hypothetical protein
MLRYTHIFDLLYKLTALVLYLVLYSVAAEHLLPKITNQYLELVIFLVGMGVFVYLLYTHTDWIPTYLYVRIMLGIKVSHSEADQLTFLFSGDYWYPLSEIREIKSEERKQALFKFGNYIRNIKAKGDKK